MGMMCEHASAATQIPVVAVGLLGLLRSNIDFGMSASRLSSKLDMRRIGCRIHLVPKLPSHAINSLA